MIRRPKIVYILIVVVALTWLALMVFNSGLIRHNIVAAQGNPSLTAQSAATMQATIDVASITVMTTNNQWTPQIQAFDGVDMALVPPGCFMLGSSDQQIEDAVKSIPDDQKTYFDFRKFFKEREQPQNKVCFDKPFWIDKTDVTNAQFARFHGQAAYPSQWTSDNRPRETITWFEARDFCAKRSTRLPTEAEWEYAARGPDDLIFPWGNTFDSSKVVWNRSFSQGTAEVGSRPDGASWVGALDMSGNVDQWTTTIYKPYPYSATDGRESKDDTNSPRVLRGGSLFSDATNLRAAARQGSNPIKEIFRRGGRCARSS